MNLNSMIAGFVGGILCSTFLFLISRALLIPKMLKSEKAKDLSFYGRPPEKVNSRNK